MKPSNTVVSVIVIAAVLVSAYALGLVIRQVRTGGASVPAATGVKNPTPPRQKTPGTMGTKDSPQEREKVKEERAKAIEKMNTATPEQKEEFRNRVRKKVGGGRAGRGLPNASSPSHESPKIKTQESSGAVPPPADANTPAPPTEGASVRPNTETPGTEPGKAGAE